MVLGGAGRGGGEGVFTSSPAPPPQSPDTKQRRTSSRSSRSGPEILLGARGTADPVVVVVEGDEVVVVEIIGSV